MAPVTRLVRQRIDLVAYALVAVVFALDLTLPEGAAVGLLYVMVLLLGLWTPRPRDVLYVAALATALSAIEYYLSPVDGAWGVNASNHVLQVSVQWVTAFGVHLHRRTLLAPYAYRTAKAGRGHIIGNFPEDTLAHEPIISVDMFVYRLHAQVGHSYEIGVRINERYG